MGCEVKIDMGGQAKQDLCGTQCENKEIFTQGANVMYFFEPKS